MPDDFHAPAVRRVRRPSQGWASASPGAASSLDAPEVPPPVVDPVTPVSAAGASQAGRALFDPVSLTARAALGQPVASSSTSWGSMLVERRRLPAGTKDFETTSTTDLCLVLQLRGQLRVGPWLRGRWRPGEYPPDAMTVSSSGEAVRWRSSCSTPWDVGHFFVPGVVIEEAAELLRPAGLPLHQTRWNALPVRDPVLATTCRQLLRAVAQNFPDLYAAQAGQWLSTHLLAAHGRGLERRLRGIGSVGRLTDARLDRTVDLVRASFAEPLTLDRLAAEAGISKFHFLRLFRSKTGVTPAKYVERVRVAEVARLLRSTDLPVNEIAPRTGFAGPDQLTAAFKRVHGQPPRTYRSPRVEAPSPRQGKRGAGRDLRPTRREPGSG